MGLDSACFEAELHACPGTQHAMIGGTWYIFSF